MPTLVFTQGSSLFEWLVRLGTLSPASHVAIGLGDKLLHVHGGGVVLEDRATWMQQRKQELVAEFGIIPNAAGEIAAMLQTLGQSYDAPGITRMVFHRAIAPTTPLRWNAIPASRTCAAFVMQLDPGGTKIPEWTGIRRDLVAPGDLLRAADKGPSFRRIA